MKTKLLAVVDSFSKCKCRIVRSHLDHQLQWLMCEFIFSPIQPLFRFETLVLIHFHNGQFDGGKREQMAIVGDIVLSEEDKVRRFFSKLKSYPLMTVSNECSAWENRFNSRLQIPLTRHNR